MIGERRDSADTVERELACLADGSLSRRREQQLAVRLQDDSVLARKLACQRRALELESAARRAFAPTPLQREVALMYQRADAGKSRPPRRALLGGVLALASACAAALIIVLSLGTSAAPTLPQTVALIAQPATLPPPKQSASHDRWLRASVQGVAFPYWGEHSAWQPSGARVDRLAGRHIETVFYRSQAEGRIGYAIVSGPQLTLHGGSRLMRDGQEFHTMRVSESNVVAWDERDHTCVLSGNVSIGTLLRLARLS